MNIAQAQHMKAMAVHVAVQGLDLLITNIHCSLTNYKYPAVSILDHQIAKNT